MENQALRLLDCEPQGLLLAEAIALGLLPSKSADLLCDLGNLKLLPSHDWPMPAFLLWLGFCSLLMLFAAGLLALLCQHWRYRWALSVAIALGLIGGLGVAGFFTLLLLPSEAIALLQQWASRNGLALNLAAIAFCFWLAWWREQKDRLRGDRPASPPSGSLDLTKHRRAPFSPQRAQSTAESAGPVRRARQRPTAAAPDPVNPFMGSRPSPASPARVTGARRGLFSWLHPQPRPASLLPSPHLQRQLNQLTHDAATSARLVSAQLAANPDRSPDWAAERAIWQLERDRCRG